MASDQREATIAESVVGLFLLVLLVLIAAGVFVRHLNWDMGRFGIEADGSKPESAVGAEAALSSFLPGGFGVLSAVEKYEPANLFEKINGKAPLYLETGFEQLTCQRFADQVDEKLIFEVYLYDMSTARNAFSVYSTQRRAGMENLAGVQFGYRTSNGVYLASGNYYVEMVGYSESQQLLSAMAETAKNIEAKFGGGGSFAEFAMLEADNLVSGSIKFYKGGAFGFEGLSETFSGRYKADGAEVTAFLSKRDSDKEAEAMAGSYKKFLIENGAKEKKAINDVLVGRVFDFYDTIEIVFSRGEFAAGVHEAENQQAAEQIALELLERLEKKAK